MATLANMISEARSLFGQTDPNNSHVSDTELTAWANEGVRKAIAGLDEDPYQEATATTVLNQAAYNMTTRVEGLIAVAMPLGSSALITELDILSISDMADRFGEEWRSNDAGQPEVAYKSATNQISLHPKPDSTHAGKTLRILYTRYQTDLAVSTDEPTLNLIVHDAIPFYMAMRAFLTVKDYEASGKMGALWEKGVQDYKLVATRVQKNNSWRWVGGS